MRLKPLSQANLCYGEDTGEILIYTGSLDGDHIVHGPSVQHVVQDPHPEHGLPFFFSLQAGTAAWVVLGTIPRVCTQVYARCISFAGHLSFDGGKTVHVYVGSQADGNSRDRRVSGLHIPAGSQIAVRNNLAGNAFAYLTVELW